MTKKAKPFRFHLSLHLLELTDEQTSDLVALNSLIRRAPNSAIYFHTHHFRPSSAGGFETPNDFALWVSAVLREEILSERLASIDVAKCPDVADLRQRMIQIIKDHLLAHGDSLRVAPKGQEFHLINPVTFVIATSYVATNLEEFIHIIRNVSLNSLSYHLFEARIRFGEKRHFFSNWLDSLDRPDLAEKIRHLNCYNYPSLEDVRAHLLALFGKHLCRKKEA